MGRPQLGIPGTTIWADPSLIGPAYKARRRWHVRGDQQVMSLPAPCSGALGRSTLPRQRSASRLAAAAAEGSSPARRRRRHPLLTVATAVAIPGPLLIDGFGRDKVPSFSRQLSPGGFVEFPFREDNPDVPKKTPPLVRVRLAVEYRVHSRQMLCVGGSQIPFGWSFLSIAKVPMSWNPRDVWTVEVELPAGTKVEYKYVILEEQDWTQQVNEATEGTVEYTYRIEPDTRPPDIQRITKQMAIVAWQPGPNRILQVPTEDELSQLRPGESIERVTPPPPQGSQRSYGSQAVGRAMGGLQAPFSSNSEPASPPRPEELSGMWEILTLDEDGRPFLDRRDIWAFNDPPPRRVTRRPLSPL